MFLYMTHVSYVSIPEPLSAGVALWIVAEMVDNLPRGVSALIRRDDAAGGEVLDALVRAGTLDVPLPVDGVATGLGEQVAAENLVRGVWVSTLQVLGVNSLTLIHILRFLIQYSSQTKRLKGVNIFYF